MTNSEAKVTPTKPARLAVAEHFKKVKRDNVALLEACKEAEEMLSIDASGSSARFLSALQIVRVSLRQTIANSEGR